MQIQDMLVCGIRTFKVLLIFSKKMFQLIEQNAEHTCLWLISENNFQISIFRSAYVAF